MQLGRSSVVSWSCLSSRPLSRSRSSCSRATYQHQLHSSTPALSRGGVISLMFEFAPSSLAAYVLASRLSSRGGACEPAASILRVPPKAQRTSLFVPVQCVRFVNVLSVKDVRSASRYAQESSPIKRASAPASSHVVADRPLHLCAAQYQPAPRRNPHQLRQQAHDRTSHTSKTSTPQAPLDRQPITLGEAPPCTPRPL